VLAPDDVRAELEPVDPEGLDTELTADETDCAARSLAVELLSLL
jgi:hypothetical protein